MRDKIETMRIEVTYIDDSEPKKRLRLHLPKWRTPQPSPEPSTKPAKPLTTKRLKPGVPKAHVPSGVKKVAISAGVLMVLLLAAGVVYTWFADQSTTVTLSPASTTTTSAEAPIKPIAPRPNAQEGVALELATSPVSRGAEATVTVHTDPTSTCTIAVIYKYDYQKKQTPISDPNLGKQVADDYGEVSWTWTISQAAQLGPGKATVTCTYGSHTAVVAADIVVQ